MCDVVRHLLADLGPHSGAFAHCLAEHANERKAEHEVDLLPGFDITLCYIKRVACSMFH